MLWKKGKHSKLTVRMTHVALLKLLLSKTFTKEASQELFACSFCVKLCVESHCANRSGSIAPASVEGEWVFYLDSISSHFIHHYIMDLHKEEHSNEAKNTSTLPKAGALVNTYYAYISFLFFMQLDAGLYFEGGKSEWCRTRAEKVLAAVLNSKICIMSKAGQCYI